jgi:hypothetical protein
MKTCSNLVYPNPFKPSGIEFELPQDSIVSLELLDVSGTIIEQVIHEEQYLKGRHTLESSRFSVPVIRYYRLTVMNDGKPLVETKPFPQR